MASQRRIGDGAAVMTTKGRFIPMSPMMPSTPMASQRRIGDSCGVIADLWLAATFPLLWDLAARLLTIKEQRETEICLIVATLIVVLFICCDVCRISLGKMFLSLTMQAATSMLKFISTSTEQLRCAGALRVLIEIILLLALPILGIEPRFLLLEVLLIPWG